MAPLVEEVPVDIYAVWFTQVLGYKSAYRRQVLGLEAVGVLNVLQFAGEAHSGSETAFDEQKQW